MSWPARVDLAPGAFCPCRGLLAVLPWLPPTFDHFRLLIQMDGRPRGLHLRGEALAEFVRELTELRRLLAQIAERFEVGFGAPMRHIQRLPQIRHLLPRPRLYGSARHLV